MAENKQEISFETRSIHMEITPIANTEEINRVLRATPYAMTWHWRDDTLVLIVSYDNAPHFIVCDSLFESIEIDLKRRLFGN